MDMNEFNELTLHVKSLSDIELAKEYSDLVKEVEGLRDEELELHDIIPEYWDEIDTKKNKALVWDIAICFDKLDVYRKEINLRYGESKLKVGDRVRVKDTDKYGIIVETSTERHYVNGGYELNTIFRVVDSLGTNLHWWTVNSLEKV